MNQIKILHLAKYTRLGASSRMRSYQYFPALEKKGFHIDTAPLFNDTYLNGLYQNKINKALIIRSYVQRLFTMIHCRQYDLIWLENEVLPWMPSWIENLLAGSGIRYIVDYDDAIFHRYDMHSSRLVKKLLGHKIDRVMEKAWLVMAGNSYLAERALRAGARQVDVLPTVIDLDRYPVSGPSTPHPFNIGWIGSPVTAPYFHQITPVLEKLCQENSDIRIVTIGAGTTQSRYITDHKWSESTETGHIHHFDVGIMPLPDTPWTRGKCGYKLIQYMACGKPVVASAVGANIEIVDHGDNGFLVNSDEEWMAAFSRLYRDRPLRNGMGLCGRKKVERHYCLQRTVDRLACLLRSCAAG